MRRVVVTGVGIVSSLGCAVDEVLQALRSGRSGVVASPEMAELGFRCPVWAPAAGWTSETIPRRALQTMPPAAQYALSAAQQALEVAGLAPEALRTERAGAVVSTALGGLDEACRIERMLVERRRPSRVGGTGIVKVINSTAAGNLAAHFGIQGRTYSISSACASGVDSIGHAYELIGLGLQDLCLAGGAEELVWRTAGVAFEAAGSLATACEGAPEQACRPYDRARRGLVLSEGAGIVVLEALEHAQARGARPLAEVVAYAAANDGADMFHPSGEGIRTVLRSALAAAAQRGVERIDYVNSHGTGTRVGDAVEAGALRDVFGDGAASPLVSSTKGHAGHGMGAAGAQEVVYALLMLEHGFVTPTANLQEVDPACDGIRHVQQMKEEPFQTVLKLSAGFGGSNACLVLRRVADGDGARP